MFFNAFNFMVVQMIGVFRLMTGQFETNETFYMFSGVEVNVEEPRLVQIIINQTDHDIHEQHSFV